MTQYTCIFGLTDDFIKYLTEVITVPLLYTDKHNDYVCMGITFNWIKKKLDVYIIIQKYLQCTNYK